MKTRDFIKAIANGEQTREKSVSSIYFDSKHIYSYGHHYPLLVHVGNCWIVNDSGYSVTTSKHIGIAAMYAQYRTPSCSIDPARMLEDTTHAVMGLREDIAKLTKRAFAKRVRLEEKLRQYEATAKYLKMHVK